MKIGRTGAVLRSVQLNVGAHQNTVLVAAWRATTS
jgi:hypothetical protein